MLGSPKEMAAATLRKDEPTGKASRALVRRVLVLVAGGVIELLARRVHKHRILRALAVVDFRARELEAGRFDFRRSIFDQQDGQAVGRDLIDLGDHHAEAVRIDEPRIDPALAGLGRQLVDVDFPRR